MTYVVGVAFRQPGKYYHFEPGGLELTSGDWVIVNTAKGVECGEVVKEAADLPDDELVHPLKSVLRRAGDDDRAIQRENLEREKEAFKTAQKKIAEHELDMRLVSVELLFDRSKMSFFFTADNRVDFRELVKDLANDFKTRIDLRQIGVRDKAKMVGGLGQCGQHLCCTVFLSGLEPVSIKMAKEQNLPLNPQKISGVCGRLMCCLRYEVEAYKDFNRRAPKKGANVHAESGESGRVRELNVLRERVIFTDEEGHRQDFPLAQVKCCGEGCAHKKSDTGRTEKTDDKPKSEKSSEGSIK